jgi:hypothetical protein
VLPGWCIPPPCPEKTRGEDPALLNRSQPCFSAGRKITCWFRVLPKVELEVKPSLNTAKAGLYYPFDHLSFLSLLRWVLPKQPPGCCV